jgi:hypothetical protein
MNQSLRITRGDTKTFNLILRLNNAAFNLSQKTLFFTAKYSMEDLDAAAVISKSTNGTDEITITNEAGGLANLKLKPVDTSSLPPFNVPLLYDLQAVDVNGDVFTVLRGVLMVTPDITISTS